jgi:hypothetical protein
VYLRAHKIAAASMHWSVKRENQSNHQIFFNILFTVFFVVVTHTHARTESNAYGYGSYSLNLISRGACASSVVIVGIAYASVCGDVWFD